MLIDYENKFRIASDIPQKDIEDIILRCGDTLALGLGNGKMNLVLFLYACKYYFNSVPYGLLADDVLSDIYEEIGRNSSLDLEGLYGVGCGIEFLIQHSLVDGNSDIVLAELDMKIMEQVPFSITSYDLCKYEGYIYYILCRLISPRSDNNIFYPFGGDYLEEIRKFILRLHSKSKRKVFMLFIKYMNGEDIVFNWNDILLRSLLMNKYKITV